MRDLPSLVELFESEQDDVFDNEQCQDKNTENQ